MYSNYFLKIKSLSHSSSSYHFHIILNMYQTLYILSPVPWANHLSFPCHVYSIGTSEQHCLHHQTLTRINWNASESVPPFWGQLHNSPIRWIQATPFYRSKPKPGEPPSGTGPMKESSIKTVEATLTMDSSWPFSPSWAMCGISHTAKQVLCHLLLTPAPGSNPASALPKARTSNGQWNKGTKRQKSIIYNQRLLIKSCNYYSLL
jgi:hypothetical protein